MNRNNSIEEKRVFSVVLERKFVDRLNRESCRMNCSRSSLINAIVGKYFAWLDGGNAEDLSPEGGER